MMDLLLLVSLFSLSLSLPTSNGGMQNGSSVEIYCILMARTFLARLYAQSMLINKILHRSSVASLLRVCCWLGSLAEQQKPSEIVTHRRWVWNAAKCGA